MNGNVFKQPHITNTVMKEDTNRVKDMELKKKNALSKGPEISLGLKSPRREVLPFFSFEITPLLGGQMSQLLLR